MEYIIGIDIGTSGTKAIAFTKEGQVSESTYESYSIISEISEEQELDPGILLQAVINVVKDLLKAMAGKGQLAGLSFSCAMHSLMAIDEFGTPLTRAITWADLRSRDFAKKLKGTQLGNRIYEHTGTPIHAMSPICKIMWIKDKKPEIFKKSRKFISIKEYVWFQFFGKYQIDYSIASATGLFDIRTFNWYPDSLMAAGISADQLSQPVPPTHVELDLKERFCRETGLPQGIPFVIGANDGCLANLGSNAVLPGELALTIGTSGAVRMISPEPRPDPLQRTFNYVLIKGVYVCGGAVNNGGNAVKWYVDYIMNGSGAGAKDLDTLVGELSIIAPGSDGLIFLPYLFGERSPIWDADAKAVFFGIKSTHDSRYFLRAVIEGVGFGLYQTSFSLAEQVGPIERIYASGGFIRSELWLQLIADIFNKPVSVTNIADASAVGAAIMGWHALGFISSLDHPNTAIHFLKTYLPDAEAHAIYMNNYLVFSGLYEHLKSDFSRAAKK
jgi:gluconokinase